RGGADSQSPCLHSCGHLWTGEASVPMSRERGTHECARHIFRRLQTGRIFRTYTYSFGFVSGSFTTSPRVCRSKLSGPACPSSSTLPICLGYSCFPCPSVSI